jgi:hypothetical protein
MPHYSYATGFGSSDIDEPLSEPQIEADRRRHVRFEVNLLGRFMRADKNEYPCRAISISVGDAAFMSPVTVTTGERVVAYLDSIGGIEGVVTRVIDGGFAVKISATQHKREKLAAQITWLINRAELDGMEARRTGCIGRSFRSPRHRHRSFAGQTAGARHAPSRGRHRRSVPRHPEPRGAAAFLRVTRAGRLLADLYQYAFPSIGVRYD